jgi:hypothetical protein
MILYHINLGFPLVDNTSILSTKAKQVLPRDNEAAIGIDKYSKFENPTSGYKEQVFYHDLIPDSDGNVKVEFINKSILNGLCLYIKYSINQLPIFIEWKMMGLGTYVVGIEPANSYVEGRAKERERGTLQFLEPGEEKKINLEIGIKENFI